MKKIKVLLSVTLVAVLALFAGLTPSKAQDEPIKIGILQHVSHVALDDTRDGFIEQMEDLLDGQVEWDLQNANGDMSTLQSLSEKVARDNDIIFAIATPAAQALATVEQEKPIFFAAVAAPVEAQLVDSLEEPGRNLTGTTNLGPIEDHVNLLLELYPEAKTIGTIYNSSEVNAEHQVKIAKEVIEEKGLEYNIKTVTNTNDISQVMQALVNESDAILLVTDNTIDSSITLVGDIAKEAGVGLIGSSDSAILANGLATISNSYLNYGKQTADMVKHMLDEDLSPSEIPVEIGNSFELVVNEDFAEAIGIDVSTLEKE
ncbi:ABC transporter substrate-binding protein [Aerococcaceae bacterium WGS1372]